MVLMGGGVKGAGVWAATVLVLMGGGVEGAGAWAATVLVLLSGGVKGAVDAGDENVGWRGEGGCGGVVVGTQLIV